MRFNAGPKWSFKRVNNSHETLLRCLLNVFLNTAAAKYGPCLLVTTETRTDFQSSLCIVTPDRKNLSPSAFCLLLGLTDFGNCQLWHLGFAASNYGVVLTSQLSLLHRKRSCQLMLSSLVRHWQSKSNSILAWQVLIGRWQPRLACLFPNSCCSRGKDCRDCLHGRTGYAVFHFLLLVVNV